MRRKAQPNSDGFRRGDPTAGLGAGRRWSCWLSHAPPLAPETRPWARPGARADVSPPGETFATISLQTVLPCPHPPPPPPPFLQHFSGKKNIFACSACVGAAGPWGRGVRTEVLGEMEERIKTRPRTPVGFVPCVWYGGVKRPRTARRRLAGSAACSSLMNGN